jgi:hypothetical protein
MAAQKCPLPIFYCTPGSKITTFGSQTSTTFGLAWLFVKLATSHFSFQATSLNELAEAADCLLNRFAVANTHDNH